MATVCASLRSLPILYNYRVGPLLFFTALSLRAQGGAAVSLGITWAVLRGRLLG